MVEHIQKKGIAVQSWYPLGGRGHTGAMFRSPVLQKIAAAQVILRWNLQRGVCVIPGSSNPEHIWENISIFAKGSVRYSRFQQSGAYLGKYLDF